MASRKLEIVISGNDRDAQAMFARVEAKTAGMGEKLAGIGKKIAIGLGAAGVGAIALGSEVLELGSKLDAWRQKTDTVFEGQAATVRKWADNLNERFGVTDDELAGLAASFGDLLKPMGFTADQAADMSKKVVGLSGALSAWSGGQRTAAEVSDILAKAMLGERDGLKELGISISEADVQARLAAKGQQDLTGAALEQAKALATQELIFEKSTDAQKAWAEGGNKSLEAQNKLKASIGELKERIATALVPAFAAVTAALADKLVPAFETAIDVGKTIGNWMSEHQPVAIALAVVVGGALTAAFVAWAAAAAAAAASTIAATAPVLAIGAALAALVAGIIYAYQNWDTFRNVVDTVGRFLRDTLWPALEAVAGFITDKLIPAVATAIGWWWDFHAAVWEVGGGIKDAIANLGGFITDVGSTIWDGLLTGLDAVLRFIGEAIEDLIGAVIEGVNRATDAADMLTPGDTFHDIKPPDIDLGLAPRTTTPNKGRARSGWGRTPFAQGGIALARFGGVDATLAEAGHDEAVLPLPHDWQRQGLGGGRGGNTFVFNIDTLVADDGDAAQRWLMRVMSEARRKNLLTT